MLFLEGFSLFSTTPPSELPKPAQMFTHRPLACQEGGLYSLWAAQTQKENISSSLSFYLLPLSAVPTRPSSPQLPAHAYLRAGLGEGRELTEWG